MSESPYIPEAVSQFRDLALEAMPDESELSPETARQYCKHLATHHYENFSVVSWFLPGELRPHFYNVYAYCRWSDDLADETGDSAVSLELLDWWNKELNACFQGNPRHPVFVALADTIRMFDIPITPFQNLLTAFRQDQCVTRYETYEDLQGYCRNSANPVGHLVLYLSGYRDEERRRLSGRMSLWIFRKAASTCRWRTWPGSVIRKKHYKTRFSVNNARSSCGSK